MNEQARSPQIRQMLNTKLVRFARWMQGVGKQKQSGNKIWLGRAEHRRLASPVGVTAEKDPSRDDLTQDRNRVAQTRAISFRIPRKWRPSAAILTKGKIATENRVAMFRESFTDRH
jgi:hypothetical protein